MMEDWLAFSGVGFLRAVDRDWSDFETGLAAGIEVDIWMFVLQLRGELKGLKESDSLHGDALPFAPQLTGGGFVGVQF